jgi:hypothetical protein
MSDKSRLLVIGLPETGKTTFLAATWHVATSDEVPGSLRLQRISEDAKHLNTIKNDWVRFKPVGRTVPGQEQSVSFWFKEEKGRTVGEVIFPDLSGETFRHQWADQQWTPEYGELVESAGSLLLFIHPSKVKEPYTIAQLQRMAQAAFPEEEGRTDPEPEEQPSVGPPIEWNPEVAPTQVQLVGLLQFIEASLRTSRPVRLAVIVSAWDLINIESQDRQSAAEQWLRQRLPYLDQYLRSNFEQFTARVYGVSAQGGDLEADRERLREFEQASERILIEGPDCTPHDITEPIRWALRLRQGAGS